MLFCAFYKALFVLVSTVCHMMITYRKRRPINQKRIEGAYSLHCSCRTYDNGWGLVTWLICTTDGSKQFVQSKLLLFCFSSTPNNNKIFCSLLASICKKLGGKYGHTMKNTIGLYTIHLTVMAVRLMVEYGMAKLLTICQAIFWDCLWLWDGCIMAKDGEKW